MPKITKREVDTAEPRASRYYLWDSEVKGFGLLVMPSGTKVYFLDYRTPEGVKRRYTIGKHGAVTPEQARTKAKAVAAEIVTGANPDPVGHKQARRTAPTVAELLDAYLRSAKFAEKAQATQSVDRGRVVRHLVPLIGKVIADKLTPEQVRKAFADIRDGKTACDVKTGNRGRAIVKGGEGAARMAIRLLRSALTWAVEEGYLASNVASGVKIGTDGSRDVILHDVAQYKSLFSALDHMEQERLLRPQVANAVRVIALTGARRNEIASLKWSHVDLKRGLLVLPPSQHKTGGKTGKPREIGLPAAAQAIIAAQPEGQADNYVFPPTAGNGPISLSKPWRAIRKEAGLPEGIGLHGLRHSLASMMAVQGAQAAEIMATLGHRQLSTAQRYIHWAQDAKASLVERHTAGISAAMEGKKSAQLVTMELKSGKND